MKSFNDCVILLNALYTLEFSLTHQGNIRMQSIIFLENCFSNPYEEEPADNLKLQPSNSYHQLYKSHRKCLGNGVL